MLHVPLPIAKHVCKHSPNDSQGASPRETGKEPADEDSLDVLSHSDCYVEDGEGESCDEYGPFSAIQLRRRRPYQWSCGEAEYVSVVGRCQLDQADAT